MPIAYPASLPAPQRWLGVPRERRALSTLPGMQQQRGRSRDPVQDIDAAWLYQRAQMEAWREWFQTDLVKGQRWFAVTAPGSGGRVTRVVRFRTGSVRREYIGLGVWRVAAVLEQRGRSMLPALAPPAALNWTSGVVPLNPFTPTMPAYEAGYLLLLITASVNSLVTPAGYTLAFSSGGAGPALRAMARIADGTATDVPTVLNGDPYNHGAGWTMISIAHPLEDDLVIGGAQSGTSNPPKSPHHSRGTIADYVCLSISATHSNAEDFVGNPAVLSGVPPDGFEVISDLDIPSWDEDWLARHMVTYKLISAAAEIDPGPFGLTGANYHSGGASNMTLMIRYQP